MAKNRDSLKLHSTGSRTVSLPGILKRPVLWYNQMVNGIKKMSDIPDYLRKLNDQQYEAATTVEGPILILAGAGSGKTGTMTHRIAYMVKEAGISPYSILAVTFTNKAAGEMRDRVEALIGPVTGMWIQTFHSACLRILRSDADRLGYKKSFVIYDPVDQKALMKSLVKERELDDKHYAPAYVLSEISKAKEKQLSPEDFRRHYGDMDHYRKLAELYSAYETELLKNNAMDFDDLILNTVRLFESEPDVLESYRRKFRYIMVDEYQDTNMLQYRLVSLLAKEHRNICVVGDDDQCIYEWRGADIRNIMEFEKDFPGARVIKLEQNYRSTGNILEAAHSVISRNRGRKDKKLWTGAGAGEKVEYHRADSDTEEARYAAARIEAMRRKDPDLKYSDFAILYRANVQSRRFEDCLSGRSIPYQVLSGLRYYDRKEIKDILAYMRLVQDPDDDVSFLRIVNEPKRGAGDKALELIRSSAAEDHTSLLEAMIAPEVLSGVKSATAEAFKSLYELVISLGSEREGMAVADIYDTLLVKSGYLPALEEQDSVEADARIENLLEFKSVIAEKEKESSAAGEKLTLENFMEGLALISDVDNHDPDQDSVSLMTLHSAKGLEFRVVFMPGMEDGLFPSYRSLDRGEGVEEERRLCYVGMTRAKEKLFLTSAEYRLLYGKTERTRESMFLREIDRKFLTGDAVYERKEGAYPGVRYDTEAPYSTRAYVSPIAAMRAVKESVKKPAETLAGVDIKPGDVVEHEKFGQGTVIEMKGSILTVIFKSCGTKKLAKDLAPMKKVK